MNINNPDEVGKWVSRLIAEDKLEEFYKSKYWYHLRKQVLAEHKGECQRCKERGFYTPANTVHHVQYVRKHPRFALSKTYEFQGKEYENLIPLCWICHQEVHDYKIKVKEKPLTEERW